jgi:predicted 2-oxoglutarate/Fe(II)-dependent dioxygenase YbiX
MDNSRDISQLLLEPGGPVEDFHPNPDAPCFCGSGKSFNHCCGSTELVRPPPFGLFMFENYIDRKYADELVAYAEQRPGQPLMVIDNEASTPDNIVKVPDARRVTERVNLGERRQEINDLVREVFVQLAKQCVGKELDWYEAPDLMRYREGGFYMSHADSENMDPKTQKWSKVIDRDLSLLIYLNQDFEGGELSFYQFNYQVWPRAGGVAMFPSDHRYQHQAEKVTKGVRYAIVSWAAVRGVPKIAAKPPESAIMLD